MKKTLLILFALVLILNFAACGEKAEENPGNTSSPASENSSINSEQISEPSKQSSEESVSEESETVDYKELLLSEQWDQISGNMLHFFNGNGTGHYESGGMKFDIEWTIEGNKLNLLYPSFTDVPMVYEFKYENDLWILQNTSNSDLLFVRVSDQKEAAEFYAPPVVLAYYDECSTLPTADSCTRAVHSGKRTSSSNGKTNKIEYTYTLSSAEIFTDYADFLEENHFTVKRNSDDEFIVIENKYIIATVTRSGDKSMAVSIVPEDQREMSAEDAIVITENTEIKTDNYTFTFEKAEFTYELLPPFTNGYYHSYPAESGHVYIDVSGTFNNTSKRSIRINELFTAKADYNNGYSYSGFAVVTQDDGRGFDYVGSYTAADPLETCQYHCLIDCPQLVEEGTEPVFITFTLANGKTYRYDLRK